MHAPPCLLQSQVNFFFGQPIFMFDGSNCTAPYCMHCDFDAVESKFAWQVQELFFVQTNIQIQWCARAWQV
jgi:hypothetical protein